MPILKSKAMAMMPDGGHEVFNLDRENDGINKVTRRRQHSAVKPYCMVSHFITNEYCRIHKRSGPIFVSLA